MWNWLANDCIGAGREMQQYLHFQPRFQSHMKPLAAITLTALVLTGAAWAEDIFNGKDLTNWQTRPEDKGKDCWSVGAPSLDPANAKNLKVDAGTGAMINVVTGHAQSWDIATKKKFAGPIRIEVELMVPQGSNSGIYVMGEYEVQVLDSHGKADKDMGAGDIGGHLQRGRAQEKCVTQAG